MVPCKHEGGTDKCERYKDRACKVQKELYYQKNSGRVKAQTRERYKVIRITPIGKYRRYASSAKYRGLPFGLSLKRFTALTSLPCTYCKRENPTMGVDRVDSKYGYTPANSVPCCSACNYMKSDYSVKEFSIHCVRVSIAALEQLL